MPDKGCRRSTLHRKGGMHKNRINLHIWWSRGGGDIFTFDLSESTSEDVEIFRTLHIHVHVCIPDRVCAWYIMLVSVLNPIHEKVTSRDGDISLYHMYIGIDKPSDDDYKGQNQSKCWWSSQGLSRALESQTLPNLACSKYIYRSKWVNRFWLVKALSGIVQDGQNESKKTVKNGPCVHIWDNIQNRQLTGFDLDSNFQLKCPNIRRVNSDGGLDDLTKSGGTLQHGCPHVRAITRCWCVQW